MVVATRPSQPAVLRNAYAVGAATGVYDNLDRFNRVKDDLWIKDLSTDRTFVNHALTYDENSNILTVAHPILATPAGTRKCDSKHAIDLLNRVTTAEEGNYNGNSISTRSRSQTWTRSQTGNWPDEQLDLDGAGGYETTNTRTFNNANEMSTGPATAGSPTTTTATSPTTAMGRYSSEFASRPRAIVCRDGVGRDSASVLGGIGSPEKSDDGSPMYSP